MYFSYTEVSPTSSGRQSGQNFVAIYDIQNNFSEFPLTSIGSSFPLGFGTQSRDLRFAPDVTGVSNAVPIIAYTTTYSPSSGVSTNSYTLHKMSASNNVAPSASTPLEGIYSNFGSLGGGPQPGPTFYVTANNALFIGGSNATLSRFDMVNLRITKLAKTNLGSTNGAETFITRGDRTIFATSDSYVGSFKTSDGSLKKISDFNLGYEGAKALAIDSNGRYAYCTRQATFPFTNVVKIDLMANRINVVETKGVPSQYKPIASTINPDGSVLFLVAKYLDSSPKCSLAIYDYNRNVITKAIVVEKSFYDLRDAVFSADKKYVFVAFSDAVVRYFISPNVIDKTYVVAPGAVPNGLSVDDGNNVYVASNGGFNAGNRPSLTKLNVYLTKLGVVTGTTSNDNYFTSPYVSSYVTNQSFGYWGAVGVLYKINASDFSLVDSGENIRTGFNAVVVSNNVLYAAGDSSNTVNTSPSNVAVLNL
ncbi:hypothetical protein AKO1_003846 [Acrasis kona]|uniref:Uncharacterized protein n=1 Tax=Acrasis kona TaxID=1008807 RepID=A0AAW2ZIG7_9EUKA